MKVLFLSHSSAFEGAEQSLLRLLEGLDRSTFDPILVVPSARGPLPEAVACLGIDMRAVPGRWWITARAGTLRDDLGSELAAARRLVALIRSEGVELVHSNTIVRIAGAVAAATAGIPHVWHVREILAGHELRSRLPLPVTFRIVRALSDRVLAPSRAVGSQEGLGNDVRVVPNGIDAAGWSRPSGDVLRQELGLPPGTPVLAVTGKIAHHKGQEVLVRAMPAIRARVPNAQLLLFGQADERYRTEVTQRAQDLRLGEAVRFVGFRRDLPAILSEIDVIVVPSFAEPFGRTTLEAMAAGRPVVGTTGGATPEIVRDGETGLLVRPGDAAGLTDAIVRILSDPDLASRMGQAGRERVIAHFGVKPYVRGVEAVLHEAREAGGPRMVRRLVAAGFRGYELVRGRPVP